MIHTLNKIYSKIFEILSRNQGGGRGPIKKYIFLQVSSNFSFIFYCKNNDIVKNSNNFNPSSLVQYLVQRKSHEVQMYPKAFFFNLNRLETTSRSYIQPWSFRSSVYEFPKPNLHRVSDEGLKSIYFCFDFNINHLIVTANTSLKIFN